MLWQRLLSALVGIPVVLYIIFLGEMPFLALVVILSVIAIREYLNILYKSNTLSNNFNVSLLYLSSVLLPGAAYISINALFAIFMVFVIMLLIKAVLSYPEQNIETVGALNLALLYPSLMISFLVLLRQIPEQGFEYILLVLIITWASDTGAYFTGMTLGKNKLSSKLSPKKTTEGALGGVIVAIVAVLILNLFIFSLPIYIAILISLVGSVFAQLGDLYESLLKRFAGIKDSGNLIPGHGGILDRMDSLFFAAPAVYFMLSLL